MSTETDKFPTAELLNNLSSPHENFVKNLIQLMDDGRASYSRAEILNIITNLKEDEKSMIKKHSEAKMKHESAKLKATIQAQLNSEPIKSILTKPSKNSLPSPELNTSVMSDSFWPDKEERDNC